MNELRLKHHYTARFRFDGLICSLVTGHRHLLWQADRGIDPWAGLKPEMGSDLSSTLSVLTMANSLRRLLSKVSGQEEKTFTLTHADRVPTYCFLRIKCKISPGAESEACGLTPEILCRWIRALGIISVQTWKNFHPALPRRTSASYVYISTSLQHLKKDFQLNQVVYFY